MNAEELANQYRTQKTELLDLKRKHRLSPLENPMRLTALRKDVARLATELTQRSKN
ncbi:MAG: 50S ribosomal protein L29 [Schleiferiaceae bacterium]|jgi:large subunit ribosomal protein L29|nr:50S ribosomal protein L29 [Schleiferiaceae bacterium]